MRHQAGKPTHQLASNFRFLTTYMLDKDIGNTISERLLALPIEPKHKYAEYGWLMSLQRRIIPSSYDMVVKTLSAFRRTAGLQMPKVPGLHSSVRIFHLDLEGLVESKGFAGKLLRRFDC
jgi:hypothetical protein